VKAEDLTARAVTDVGSALQGKTSGVQVMNMSGSPGAAATLRIRGFASNGESNPLYVVDGLKVANLSAVGIENIESIEILKDGASAAIYGAEAGNGVVLITTKTGKKEKGQIFVTAQYSISNIAKKMNMLNAEQFIKYTVESGTRTSDLFAQYYYNDPSNYVINKPVDTDWQDIAYSTGYRQKYTVGFQGGNNRGSLFLSLGYLNHDGVITGSKDSYNQISSQINASYKIKDWIEVGTTNSIEVSKLKSLTENNIGRQSFTSNIYEIDPLTPVEYADGLRGVPDRIKNAMSNGYQPLFNTKTGNYYGTSFWGGLNPLAMLNRDDAYSDVSQINGTAFINLTPLKNFVLTSRLGYRFMYDYDYSYTAPYWMSTVTYLSKTPALSIAQSGTNYYQWENFANYTFELDRHAISVLAGTSYINSFVNTTTVDTDELTNLNENFHYLDYSTATANDLVGGNKTESRQLAWFGRFSWTGADRYNIQVNFRADSYDAAYLDLEHNWGYFPSISAGWTFSNEEFMQKLTGDILSHAKLRASYGKNGSIGNLGGYMYASVLNTGNQYYMNNQLITGTYPTKYLANEKLRWEESVQFDLGLDLRIFKERLVLGVDYFTKNTNGLLVESVAPLVTGASFVWQNVGKVNNRGFEVELEWRDKINDNFSYNIRGNIATVKNKVTEYRGEGVRLGGTSLENTTQVSYVEEGYPLWYLRGYVVEGINPADGSPIYKDIVPDGEITDADKTMIGNGIPDFTYGLTVSLKYKDFDFMAFGTGAYGNKVIWGMNRALNYTSNKPLFFYEERWTAENPNAKRAAPVYHRDERYMLSDANVFDASYFKIKQIQLGYTFPKRWLDNVKIFDLRAYVSLEDFFTFTDYPGQDPELRPNATSGMAIDFGSYPVAKSILLGLNFSF
jgi:TonB-linked SusC/RagA family outer membrane protein